MDVVTIPGLRPELEDVDLVVEFCMPITGSADLLGTVRLTVADGPARHSQAITLGQVDRAVWHFLQHAHADRRRFRATSWFDWG